MLSGPTEQKSGSGDDAAGVPGMAATSGIPGGQEASNPDILGGLSEKAHTQLGAKGQLLGEEARQKLAEGEKQFALSLMRIISVLSRSPHYRHYTISDLEWLVLPPLRLGQCAILHAETPGVPVAAAVALWASVSPEVDLKLSQNLTVPIRLRPDEWRSGDILWLVDVIGASDAISQLLTRLKSDALKGQQVKLRQVANGRAEVAFAFVTP